MRDEANAVSTVSSRRRSRGGFVMTSLMSGLTLATTRVEAQVIHTDAEASRRAKSRSRPATGRCPPTGRCRRGRGRSRDLVVEEIFGVPRLHQGHLPPPRQGGYCAVAPELYARQGDLSKMTDRQADHRRGDLQTPDAQWIADLDATVAWATSAAKGDGQRLGVMGWCRGGRAVCSTTRTAPNLKAAVAWNGPVGGERTAIQPRTAGDVAGEIHAPLLALYGGRYRHPRRPPSRRRATRPRRRQDELDGVVFPEAPHGFHADYRPSYRKEAAEDGWARALALLQGSRGLTKRKGTALERFSPLKSRAITSEWPVVPTFDGGCVRNDTAVSCLLCDGTGRICACAGPAGCDDALVMNRSPLSPFRPSGLAAR